MRNATEEDKENIIENIIEVYGMPDTYRVAFDKLWQHQIPESSKEWINNLAEIKERLDELEEERTRLSNEYKAQCFIGMGLYATLTEEDTNENPSYQEI